jgi:zinc transport system substrate-binding protein
MKKTYLLFFVIFLLSACHNKAPETDRGIISVSIEPFRFFTEAIAGDTYSVNVIVPPGASPATYEPPPSVIKDIKNSELMIINAYLGFELAWIERVTGLNEEMKVLRLADSQDLIAADSHRHGDIIHYTGVDPHFWLSPRRARIIARDIRDFLLASQPADSVIYLVNYLKLDSLIQSTDEYLEELFDEAETRAFIIYHPSLTYLAHDYGLEQISVETEGKEPSPSELKKLIDYGREKDIKVIFVQREFDRKNADIIGKEIGAETVVIDPLSSNWVESVRNIAENIAGKIND